MPYRRFVRKTTVIHQLARCVGGHQVDRLEPQWFEAFLLWSEHSSNESSQRTHHRATASDRSQHNQVRVRDDGGVYHFATGRLSSELTSHHFQL
jgi:hypothetical protein